MTSSDIVEARGVSISSRSVTKGVIAGVFDRLLGAVGRGPITGDSRFTFGINDVTGGLDWPARAPSDRR